MANNVISSSMITAETQRIIHNNSAFLGKINTQFEDQFAKVGKKAGSTINVRNPIQVTIRDGATASIQDVNESTVPLTIQPEFGADMAFSDFDLNLSIDDFSNRYIKPVASRLASELDRRIGALYTGVANFSGTAGTQPSTVAHIMDAAAILDSNSCPQGDRHMVLSPYAQASVVGGFSGLFNSSKEVSEQYKSGSMGSAFGFDWAMSQNVPSHTVGVLGGTPTVNGANQGLINSGATDNPYAATTSLITQAWTSAVAVRLKAGDVFTIAGVYAVNPETKISTSKLQQFTCTADASSDGAGALTAIISPAIIAGGAYQTVTARPASGAAITILTGTASTAYRQNFAYHKDAITLATVDMILPKSMEMASQTEVDGVNIRFVRGYDITNNRYVSRFDIMAGMAITRPSWVVRLTS